MKLQHQLNIYDTRYEFEMEQNKRREAQSIIIRTDIYALHGSRAQAHSEEMI